MAKDYVLHIRLSFPDEQRLRRVAKEQYLDMSVWARQTLLKALDQYEARRARAVAERPKPK